MINSALYKLYTDDYSSDSVRQEPVTVQELVCEGIALETAEKFIELSERLYYSFLVDTMHRRSESNETLSIWKILSSFSKENNISESYVSSSFCLYGYDVVLDTGNQLIPRDIAMFRLRLEQALSQVSLIERQLHYEYDLLFTITDDNFWRVVRFNIKTQSLDDIQPSELQSIISRLRMRRKKVEVQISQKVITEQLASAHGNDTALKEILENEYRLIDENDELESLECRLQEILNQPPVHNLSTRDFLWVLMGKDRCTEDKHHIIDVRANFEFYNGSTHKVKIRRCAHCKQYQVTFEQFEDIWKKIGLPRVEIIYFGANDNIDGNYWRDRSVFSDHGYSVSQEKGLTATQRQQKLKWIIDHGVMSKYETIRFLRSRISINGMKPENWLARSKWEKDLLYVQSL